MLQISSNRFEPPANVPTKAIKMMFILRLRRRVCLALTRFVQSEVLCKPTKCLFRVLTPWNLRPLLGLEKGHGVYSFPLSVYLNVCILAYLSFCLCVCVCVSLSLSLSLSRYLSVSFSVLHSHSLSIAILSFICSLFPFLYL